MSNQIDVTYKSGKGTIRTRTVTNIQTCFGLHNGKQQWIMRALCCDSNKDIVIELQGCKFS